MNNSTGAGCRTTQAQPGVRPSPDGQGEVRCFLGKRRENWEVKWFRGQISLAVAGRRDWSGHEFNEELTEMTQECSRGGSTSLPWEQVLSHRDTPRGGQRAP